MTDTATPTGVDEAEIVVGNIARNETVERIAKAAQEARDKELADAGHEVVDTSGGTEAPAEEAPKEEEKPAEVIADKTAEITPEPDKPKMVKVKVDGKEMEVPEQQILDAGVRTLQKETAADQRLAEANRILNEAKEVVAPKVKPLPEMDAVELTRRIRLGNDEEAQEAIRLLQGRPQATPEQIAEAVESRVLGQIEAKEAGNWFIDEYKDIVGDPYLASIIVAENERLSDSGDNRPLKARYKEIGDNVRAKLTEWRGGKATVSTTTDKLERKSTIENLPSASARQQAPEQPKPETPSEIIQKMREARGQR
jgi:hypothetical protein